MPSLKRQFLCLQFAVLLLLADVVILALYVPLLLLRRLRAHFRAAPPPAPVDAPLVSAELHAAAPGAPARGPVVLVHGFPDGPDLWARTVAALQAAGRACIVVALPGCAVRRGGLPPQARVPTPDAVARALHAAVAPHIDPKGAPPTLVLHDWGVLFGLRARALAPALSERVVLVDVAPRTSHTPSTVLCMLAYQVFLALAFLVGGRIGDSMVRRLLADVEDYMPRALQDISAGMAWPYYMLFRAIFRGAARAKEKAEREVDGDDNGDSGCDGKGAFDVAYDLKQTPTLFVFGTKKLFMFHSEEFVRQVEQSRHGRVESLRCGHWPQVVL